MFTPHSFQRPSEVNGHLHAPPSSPSFQMPNVFVIPPEEEQLQTPPWCCFSAAQDGHLNLSTTPDFGSLDIALHILQDTTPTFSRSSNDDFENIVMPKKVGENIPMSGEKYDKQPACPTISTAETESDSIVVELVEFEESDVVPHTHTTAPTMKRSKTFMSRASGAFQSIKSVGKIRNRKLSAKDTCPSNTSTPTLGNRQPVEKYPLPAPRALNRTLSRRSTTVLPPLFQSPKADSSPPSTAEAAFSPLSPPESSSSPSTYLPHQGTAPFDDQPSCIADEPTGSHSTLRSSSSSTKSFRRRFSVLDLHRFFSFPSSPTSNTFSSLSTSTASLSISRGVSSSSDGFPETPVDDIHETEVFPKTMLAEGRNLAEEGGGLHRDLNFDMTLGSLHFDSLSFDPHNF